MPAGNVIDGRAIAEQIHQETVRRIAQLQARGIVPRLIFVRVGEDAASRVYVGMKEKTCARLGVSSQTFALGASASEKELLELVERLNADCGVHGILVQAPLPRHISEARIY